MALDLKPDLITLGNILPDMMGFDVLEILTEAKLDSKIIFVSAVGQKIVVNKLLEVISKVVA